MPSFGVNIIRVGSDQFLATDNADIDSALSFTRTTFMTVGHFLDRIERYSIPVAAAKGREILNNKAEAEALTTEWTVDNNNIDVFVVRSYVGTVAGTSPAPGPCDKNAKGMNGAVVEIVSPYTGYVMAHEIGHYLGLQHEPDTANLMYENSPNGGQLTAFQGFVMNCHCFSPGPCIG